MPRVLIVEDDAAMRDMVSYTLAREKMDVEAVANGESGLKTFQSTGPFDLVILDIGLPGMDGIEVCRKITASSHVPVIMLTARGDETSVVVGLEVGADDYIAKPFSLRELVSRVRTRLRRRRLDALASNQDFLKYPGLEIDFSRHQVTAQGEEVGLTAAQFKILALLAAHPGRVYSRQQIMEPIWGNEFSCVSRAADVHIQNIRRQIEPDPKNPRYIQTVRGTGYRFAEF